jgi:hypothetical protein
MKTVSRHEKRIRTKKNDQHVIFSLSFRNHETPSWPSSLVLLRMQKYQAFAAQLPFWRPFLTFSLLMIPPLAQQVSFRKLIRHTHDELMSSDIYYAVPSTASSFFVISGSHFRFDAAFSRDFTSSTLDCSTRMLNPNLRRSIHKRFKRLKVATKRTSLSIDMINVGHRIFQGYFTDFAEITCAMQRIFWFDHRYGSHFRFQFDFFCTGLLKHQRSKASGCISFYL